MAGAPDRGLQGLGSWVEKMTPDYDLSKLPASDADLWIYLQSDVIFSQIMADQAIRLGFPVALGTRIVAVRPHKPQGMFNNG